MTDGGDRRRRRSTARGGCGTPSRHAPRHSLVRMRTGRDAADVAFVTVLSGRADLTDMEITATVDGSLPVDDHAALVDLG